MSNNLYCLLESGERRTLGIVVELGLEDVVDIVGVGGDAVVEDVEVDASSATRVVVTPWLDLGVEEEEDKDEKEDCEGEEGEKYDSFVIDSDEDLHILFYCHCQFPEVRIPELLAKLVDVVSSSGGSNRNHQSVPMATASSLTLVVASSFVLVILSAGDLVASLTFAADLHRDEIAKQGANVNTPVMIPISRAVGEPDAVQDVLREDDDVDPATIVDDSDDDIGRSISVGPGGVLSSGTQKLSGRLGAPFLPKAISLSVSPQAPTLLGYFLVPPLPQLFFLLCALLATPLIRDLLSSLRCCSVLFLAIMDSTNMKVVAQEQQEETPVEETANFVPDESASGENSNKSLLKNIYWQYFSRYKEGEEWKAKCNHCKSILGANPRNGTVKKHVLHYCKRIKLANSRQSIIAESLQRHGKNSSDAFIFDASHTRNLENLIIKLQMKMMIHFLN
ncbi:hypothetical protein Ahy_B02g061053 [Arachis hypogaea]|uniref:BED-type domain-containing protein n=1 Tax=Arachis hypogaea TaxID=3818 RepID=A0A445AK35_ARAHY|nr:hypothetical protein Ahy_B02g061053 [Arachis hypogaea]